MKVFDKIRDLFTEEVEENEEEPVKKEVIQVEIPAPEAPKPIIEEQPRVEEEIAIRPMKQPEEKINYPVFFDEKDFEDIEKKEKKEEVPVSKKEVVKESYKEQYKEAYKEPSRDNYKDPYSYKKEEKKHFSPSPIISPVYGMLDKNYKKDDIIDKPRRSYLKESNMTIDDVRNKAYGTLEDELESTLFGKTSILFATKDEKKSFDDLEDELDDVAETLDLLREDHVPTSKTTNKTKKIEQDKKEEVKEEYIEEVKDDKKVFIDEDLEEDNQDNIEYNHDDLINEKDVLNDLLDDDELGDNMVEDALGKDFESDGKLSESDLFNLIDDMYEKGDK